MVRIHETAVQVEGNQKVVPFPETIGRCDAEVAFDLAPCERNADRSGEPRDLVEVLYGVAPITPIEIYDSLEFPFTDNQICRW